MQEALLDGESLRSDILQQSTVEGSNPSTTSWIQVNGPAVTVSCNSHIFARLDRLGLLDVARGRGRPSWSSSALITFASFGLPARTGVPVVGRWNFNPLAVCMIATYRLRSHGTYLCLSTLKAKQDASKACIARGAAASSQPHRIAAFDGVCCQCGAWPRPLGICKES